MPESTAEIRTELDNLAYVPGETIRGTVRWRMEKPPREAVMRLLYHTVGKGTRDVVVVGENILDGPVAAEERPFEFVLPDGPYSFSGKLVSLVWSLEIDLGRGGPVEKLDFVMSPTGQEVNLHAYAHEEMPTYGGIKIGAGKKRKPRR